MNHQPTLRIERAAGLFMVVGFVANLIGVVHHVAPLLIGGALLRRTAVPRASLR